MTTLQKQEDVTSNTYCDLAIQPAHSHFSSFTMYEVAKVANVVRVSHVNFHCNRLTTVQDIQDYVSLLLGGDTVYGDRGRSAICLYQDQTRQLKTTHGHLMLPRQHLYNRLARH